MAKTTRATPPPPGPPRFRWSGGSGVYKGRGVGRPFGASVEDGALVERVLWFALPLVLALSLAAVVLPRAGSPGKWMGAALLVGYAVYLYAQF